MFISINEADFQQVVETWNQGFSDYLVPIHIDQEALEQRIQSLKLSKRLSAVFSMEGEFAGIILLGIQTFKQTKIMWIGGMAVSPPYRRNKVASKLIEYAENLAMENQCDNLMLEVIATNERAKKLYEAKGFQLVNELAVGTMVLPMESSGANECHFKTISPQEQARTENQWTPWQNRSIFSDRNYAIYQDETKIGSISFNLVEESDGKVLIIKQLHCLNQNDRSWITDSLLALKKHEDVKTIKLSNVDMTTFEYTELHRIGIEMQLTQFQLGKQLNNK
ncbi:hypothetical protein A5821_001952 [Enterococcus sp. 7F3_DIV0205]|uniref:N-acetyltransferase domain-containing protein n=1 Tax=Candidatus Enterococcus palustris TaxID=1834189 RepID=A0AAQ3WB46_9ENTE|nr:GNAT family N-acetyltransferase [Enterococcus sp. 7F3_DIV0205]OTN82388.1 hypothetical protein A5821_002299 [Enterococcus sp. 7F3_DIV0205]